MQQGRMSAIDPPGDRLLDLPVVAVDPGAVPAANGDPLISVNPPFAAWMLNTETLFEPPFATYKNVPDRSMVTSLGPVRAENGEPASGA